MSKRKSSPPLYELIRTGHGERTHHAPRPSAPQQAQPPSRSESESALIGTALPRWLQPGRSLQIPVGYVFLAGALIVILIAGSYMFGHARGEQSAQFITEEEALAAGFGAQNASQTTDPLMTRGMTGQTTSQPRPSGVTRPPSGGTADRTQWGPILSDPREPGKMFFILITTNERGAVNLAEFCRSHGLEAYVLSSNNPRHFRVIAKPGFLAEQRTSDQVKALEALIHRIGDLWQATEPGATDLRGAYPSRYGG